MKTGKNKIMFLIVLFLSCNTSRDKNEVTRQNLNGKVKSINESTYSFSKSQDEKQQKYLYWRRYFYNDKGESTFYEEGFPNHILDSILIWNMYNDMGKLNMFSLSKGKNPSSNPGKTIYKKGGKEDIYVENEMGGLYKRYSLRHDETGDKVLELDEYGEDSILSSKCTSKYDKKGRMIEWDFFNNNSILIGKYSYKYDSRDDETEWDKYNLASNLIIKYTYTYSDYDKVGNWRTKITSENGKPVKMTKREILYY